MELNKRSTNLCICTTTIL